MSIMKGIVLHWTAGGPVCSAVDKEHYHYIVQQDGTVVVGSHTPEDNLNTTDDDYAAHTRKANTGRIGVALCGMVGAAERPFLSGPHPLVWSQVQAMYGLVASLCRQYQISVTRETVLTHAEVQATLGIPQRAKWDIAWLPGMTAPGDPVVVGDRLRKDILQHMKGLTS